MSSTAARRAEPRPEIPILDLGPYLAGKSGATARLGRELRHAFEQIGFYFIRNHGIAEALIDRVFAAASRFHALPLEAKLALKINQHNIGYLAMRAATTRHSLINPNNKPNLNEAYFVKRELPQDHPDILSGKRFRGANQWPAELPGFRDDVLAYCAAMETLSAALLPIYAHALDLAPNFFDEPFRDPQFTLRMSHYPPQDVVEENEFGLAPHTDTSFMTLLAQNAVPGLSLRLPDGRWIDAPALPGAFLVNGGDMLRRWTNDRFLATPHRVINRSGAERYAIPFFFDCRIDYEMHCLPSCAGPGNPPRHEPTTYMDYMIWFQRQNYDHVRDREGGARAVY
jgi:isopenicillin N synthase-like dioxygenase